MEALQIVEPESGLFAAADDALATADVYKIDSQEMADLAGDELNVIKKLKKDLEADRKSITKPLDEAKKRVMDKYREPAEKLERADKIIRQELQKWNAEQLRIKRAAELEAKKKAEAERKRQEAEKQQRIAEAKAKKDEEAVAAIEQEPAPPVFVPPAVDTPKTKGVSTRKTYKYEVIDFAALPDEYKLPNESALGGIARSTKGGIKIPGVKFYAEETVVARG